MKVEVGVIRMDLGNGTEYGFPVEVAGAYLGEVEQNDETGRYYFIPWDDLAGEPYEEGKVAVTVAGLADETDPDRIRGLLEMVMNSTIGQRILREAA